MNSKLKSLQKNIYIAAKEIREVNVEYTFRPFRNKTI